MAVRADAMDLLSKGCQGEVDSTGVGCRGSTESEGGTLAEAEQPGVTWSWVPVPVREEAGARSRHIHIHSLAPLDGTSHTTQALHVTPGRSFSSSTGVGVQTGDLFRFFGSGEDA